MIISDICNTYPPPPFFGGGGGRRRVASKYSYSEFVFFMSISYFIAHLEALRNKVVTTERISLHISRLYKYVILLQVHLF